MSNRRTNINYSLYITLVIILVLIFIIYKNYDKFDYLSSYGRIEPSLKIKESPYINLDNKIHYLYWTGGYDSSYRLCEMLIIEKKKVQPIYVSLPLDNDCVTEEKCNKLWVRRNRKEERASYEKNY